MTGRFGISRMAGTGGEHKWRFVAAPGCCEKCSNANGRIIYSKEKPVVSPHGNFKYDGSMLNCKCTWVRED